MEDRKMILPIFYLVILMKGFVNTVPLTYNPSDSTRDIVLTPWWNLNFAEGETVIVDCGVYSGGNPEELSLSWDGPNGQLHSKENSRVKLQRQDKNHKADTQTSAYSVLTLTISDLKKDDSGLYTCVSTWILGTSNHTSNRTIALEVNSPGPQCGFESDGLCGWTAADTGDVRWHRHSSSDKEVITRSNGPRYDHTYGPSKHAGHFIEVDLEHNGTTAANSSARLVSPMFRKHTIARCLQFWFTFDGSDQEGLAVYFKSTNTSDEQKLKVFPGLEALKYRDQHWHLGQVDLPPQKDDYQVLIESILCKDKCKNAVVTLDDIRIADGLCPQSVTQSDDHDLKIRLVNGSKPQEGRLEVLHDGRWGTVCSKNFGKQEAQVICRSLGFGFNKAEGRHSGMFGAAPKNYIIWLQDVKCGGSERHLAACLQHQIWGQTNCTHGDDVGVSCDEAIAESEGKKILVPKLSTTTTPQKTTTTTTTLPTTKAQPNTTVQAATSSTTSTTTTPTTTSTTTTTTTTKPTTTTTTTTTQTSTSTTVESTTTTTTTATPSSTSTLAPTTTSRKNVIVATTTSTVKPTESAGSTPAMPQTGEGTNNAGVAIGIIFALLVASIGVGILLYRRKRKGNKSTYITFGNPSYSKEHLPANDYSLESPLTLSSTGYSVLA